MLDVRSPAEYTAGHIPGAVSFPLFSNDERALVGTCYKQQGRDAAIELGLELVGPKLAIFVREAKRLTDDRVLRVHCWRGGMRSSSMAWLLETAGFSVTTLDGGYRSFRHWVRDTLSTPKPILTLGGMTGTGKTAILAALAALGEQVLDLEAYAHNRGSSYGSLGLPPQPSQEQFENQVAWAWAALDAQRLVWIEAESRRIGTCRIPDPLFLSMMQAPVVEIARSRSERIEFLLQDYGSANPEELVIATERLRKRLGGLRTQQAIALIRSGELGAAIDIVLDYYDQTYTYDLQKRQVPIYTIVVTGLDAHQTAQLLVEKAPFYPVQSCGDRC
jgi:tRNA 2-selenouridine synthase